MRKWSHPAQRNRQGQALPPALTVDGSAQIPNETATSPTNGTVRYQNCPNASAWLPYPQKIAIGSRSISVRRSSMCGDGSSWS